MAAEPQKTGIKNADELITLATAYGLNVTVETTDRETLTSHVVRFAIPVPTAYAGTKLGRTIAGDALTLLWTKSHRKGARGSLDDATVWSATSSRKARTLRAVTAAVETLGHDSAKYARDAAPLLDDVVDAPHALYIDGELRKENIPAERVRTFVKNRRFNGLVTHQDADGGIVCDTRRYVPVQPAPAEETPAPSAEERLHVRTVNGGAPEIIPTRDALAEINAAMMQPGKKAVRQMSESRGHSRIVYKDPARGTVDLRPLEKGQAPAGHEQRPTVQELVGPVDDALLASYAEMYAAVDDGTAIPVRADMVRPGMDVIAAVRLEDRTIDIVTNHNGPAWVRVTWTMRNHSDSVTGDARTFPPDFHLMVTVDSLTRLYGAASPTGPNTEEQHDRAEDDGERDAAELLGDGERWVKHFRVFGRQPQVEPVDRASALGTIVWALGEDWQCYPAEAGGVNLESTTGESSYWLEPVTEEQRSAEVDRIRPKTARESYAFGVRLEAQQLGTNQVIEEKARESLAAVLHEEAGEGKAGFVFRTNHRGVWLRGATSEGNDWPLLTEALQLHLEHYGWFAETSRSFGVSITPPGDARALVMEGQRRSVDTAHGQAIAENAQC
ncbi:hypothetical protein [Streptomyces phaeoluteigriseus]